MPTFIIKYGDVKAAIKADTHMELVIKGMIKDI